MQLKRKSEGRQVQRKSVLVFAAVVVVLGFVIINIVSMQIEIGRKRAELNEINAKISELNVANEQLRRYCSDENRMEYIEQIAREQLDYSYSDETVYYFVPNPTN